MDDAKKDLIFVALMLFGLAIVWFYTGGPQRPSATSGPVLHEPLKTHQREIRKETSEISEEVAKEAPKEEVKTEEPTTESAYKYKATLRAGYAAKRTDPRKEFVEIRAASRSEKPLLISGWTLEGKTGLDIKIGGASPLPYSGRLNREYPVFLNPGEKAVVVTGESPIGVSFRLNKCSGYLEQFQDFEPYIPKECPRPIDEDLPNNLGDSCLDYLERLPRCEVPADLSAIPLSPACREYLGRKINYNACVDAHKRDPDFYKPEWRIYLGRGAELWRAKRETIILRDGNGKIIDWKSY
ncbi:MAG: hypothetical protein GXP44_01185 [bacterium]|nr:hypothetical protein [bacterium]